MMITRSSGSATAELLLLAPRGHFRDGRRLRIGWIRMPDTHAVLDDPARWAVRGDRTWRNRHLAVATGDIEHIGRLAQTGEAPAQRLHEALAGRNAGTKMRGAASEIGMVKVVGFDAHRDETAKQGFQSRRIVVDAAQQHGLRQKRNGRAAEPSHRLPHPLGQLARVVCMDRHIDRLFGSERFYERVIDAARIDDGNPRVETDHGEMRYLIKHARYFGQTPRREQKRIAAGDDHLPDLRALTDVLQSALERFPVEHRTFLADDLAAEAKAAIDRAQ